MTQGIAIQFVNYKTETYARDAIKDVFDDLKNSGISHEVYVLDNASGDSLDSIDSRAHVVRSATNVGFGTGHNRLASLHDFEYILILNPDIRLVEKDTIARMSTSLKSADAAVLGGRLISNDGQQQGWDHGELDYSQALDSPTSNYVERHTKGEVAWVSGADSLIRAAAFREVSGFDENFFLYKDEEDLCLRLRQKGMKTYYDPTITIKHIGSVVANKDSHYFGESVDYYNQKHGISRL